MPLQIRGYAAQAADSALAPHAFTRRDPRPDDVVIDILYCGVCHSDLHQARNDWHNSIYPMVPGHEIIGRVSALGAQATGFKVGERVGVGCMVDSCRHCEPCLAGLEDRQRCGGDSHPADQQRLRAHAQERRALPVRHRHGLAQAGLARSKISRVEVAEA